MIYKIMLIKINQRVQDACDVQNILTKYGCNIKVRLGLHEVSNELCAQDGIIILQVDGNSDENYELLKDLNSIEFVKAQLLEI